MNLLYIYRMGGPTRSEQRCIWSTTSHSCWRTHQGIIQQCATMRIIKRQSQKKQKNLFGDFLWAGACLGLRWAKPHDSYRRIASESYRRDSNYCSVWRSYLPPEHGNSSTLRSLCGDSDRAMGDHSCSTCSM